MVLFLFIFGLFDFDGPYLWCPGLPRQFARLESPDKYLALNQKLAQAIPGEESYEQSKWITGRKTTKIYT